MKFHSTMIIKKFGGTSVGSVERIKGLVKLVNDDQPKIVVLSAMSGTTNALVEISKAFYELTDEKALQLILTLEQKYFQVLKDLYQTKLAYKKAETVVNQWFSYLKSLVGNIFTNLQERAVLAIGEILSTHIVQAYFEEQNIDVVLLDALSFMKLNRHDEPDMEFIAKNLQNLLAQYPNQKMFLTQGYICRNAVGETSNLQRGGSDYTASIIGAAIHATEIEIWTDIDGMHNNDPRFVDKTYPIHELSFDEAAELAYFGAKILHPSTILPAKIKNIPVSILNTMAPDMKGTRITANPSTQNYEAKAVAAKDGIVAIKIKSTRMLLAYGFLKNVFEVFEKYKTPIDMITTSEVAVSLTIDNAQYLDSIVKELREFCTVEVEHFQTIVCVVGNFASHKAGAANKIISALSEIPIRMISYGGSENNISFVVETNRKIEVLQALNKGVFFSEKNGV
jgi:aspartate kinase